MQDFGYMPHQRQENRGKETKAREVRENARKENIVARQPEKYNTEIKYQDMYIRYGNNDYNSKNTIQCFKEESRTLEAEVKKIKDEVEKMVNDLELEMSDFDISSQFDDDYYELFCKTQNLPLVHQTLHHILPRHMIGAFIEKLNMDEKKNILLKFLRYTEGGENDVTASELEKIRAVGTPAEDKDGEGKKLIDDMLERTLKSLRSNMVFGPTQRSDDPKGKKYDLDPNYIRGSHGKLDAISICYKEVYDKILELQNLQNNKKQIIGEIVEKLKEAETILARKQGITGEDAYRHTRLEMGRIQDWVLHLEDKLPFKERM